MTPIVEAVWFVGSLPGARLSRNRGEVGEGGRNGAGEWRGEVRTPELPFSMAVLPIKYMSQMKIQLI